MKVNYTHISALLDRSGSMMGIIHDMKGGFLQFIKEQKELPGDLSLSVAMFDNEYKELANFLDVKKTDVNLTTYIPAGSTSLIDSFCKMIDETGAKLASMKEEDRPEKVIFVCITDGEENSSTEFSIDQLRERIIRQEDEYTWQFVYLGANQDAFSVGSNMGMRGTATWTYTTDADSINHAFVNLSCNTASYRSNTSNTLNLVNTDEHKNK